MKVTYLTTLLLLLTILGFSQKKVVLEERYTIRHNRNNSSLRVLLPSVENDRQEIIKKEFSEPPHSTYELNGDKYALWSLVGMKKKEVITIKTTFLIKSGDFHTAKKNKPILYSKKELQPYLEQDSSLLSVMNTIQTIANNLKMSSEISTIQQTFNYVIENMKYTYIMGEERGGTKAITKKKGGSIEYAELMVSLCRANNIPARLIVGKLIRAYGEVELHSRAEVYLQDYGWVAFDPTEADIDEEVTFSRTRNNYIYYSINRHIADDDWNDIYNSDEEKVKVKRIWKDEISLLFDQMYLHYNEKEYDLADELLNKMIQFDPTYFRIQEFQALINAKKGQFDIAYTQLQSALEKAHLAKEIGLVHYALANYYSLKKENKLAFEAIKLSFKNCTCLTHHIQNDKDLNSLKSYPAFKEWYENYK